MTGMQGGLRERKKARTRASIREHALRLFREQTYQGTTVEQIAAAAEVSPSTFFRYFPTKEDIVLRDDMDTRMIEALERQPASLGPLSAVRAALREVFTSYTQADLDLLGETTALTMTVPEIRARAMNEFARSISAIAEALAKRAGLWTTWPSAPRPARSSASSCRSRCRGRTGQATGGPSRTCSSASTRPWPCWKPACRCEPRPVSLSWTVTPAIRGVTVHDPGPEPPAAVIGFYGTEPPVARRMRSVSRSMAVSAPSALPYSCW